MDKLRKAIRSAPFPPHVQRALAFTDTESILKPHLAIEHARKTKPSLLRVNHAASCVPAEKRELEVEDPNFRRRTKARQQAEKKADEANAEAIEQAGGAEPDGLPRAEVAASLSYMDLRSYFLP